VRHGQEKNGFLVLRLFFLSCRMAWGLEIMLPKVYRGDIELSGWLYSEKFDGVRGYWDGRRLLSRSGIPFEAPPAFTVNFPPFPLEGEIWGGRGTFEKTAAIVRRLGSGQGWLELRFAVFDVPGYPAGFEERLQQASRWFARYSSRYAFVIEHRPLVDEKQLHEELARVEKAGGEGLVLRKAGSPYTVGRSPDVLKVKSYEDSEAMVIGHLPGSGRNWGRLGALLVELPENGLRFKIGSGFSDKDRDHPPQLGSLITFKYYGRYESGLPRFPVFLRRALHE
jgi:DNA ligase-1